MAVGYFTIHHRRDITVCALSQAATAGGERDCSGTGAAPFGRLRKKVVAVAQCRRERQLGEFGQGQVHGRFPRRYLRFPWLTTVIAEPWLLSHALNLRTALVAVSEWKVTISG